MKCNCGNRFNKASYAPRVLGCGHTLCHFCISTVLNNGEIVCVRCDYKHAANGVTDIPLNFSILDTLLEDAKSSKENVCAIHKADFKGFCAKCKEFICKRCFKDLHNADFGCVEASMEEGFETLSTDPKVDHLSSLIQMYSEILIMGKTKVEEAKRVETAFQECHWSATKDRQHLELYYEDLEKKMNAMVVFKESLSKCRSLNDFNDGNKKLSTLEKVVLTMEEDATPKLLPSCANLLNNLPLVIGAFQSPMVRNANVLAVDKEKDVCFPLVLKNDGISLLLSSSRPIADIPLGAFSFEMNSTFKKFALEELEISIVWGNNLKTCASQSGPLGLKMGGCNSGNGESLKANFGLIGNPSEDIHKVFEEFFLNGKAKEYLCHNDFNFIYIYKGSKDPSIRLVLNDNRVSNIGAKVDCDGGDFEKYLLTTHQNQNQTNYRRGHYVITPDISQMVDTSKGYPVLAMKDSANNMHIVFMKFPIVNVSKHFAVVGYCKGGVVGDFEGTLTDWSTELRLL